MRLCITSTGKDIEANIDPRFGRAAWLLIIDTDTNAVEVVANNAASQAQGGAGVSAAQIVIDKNVDTLLTGRLGPNALKVFQTSGIKLIEGVSAEDTVSQVLARFKNGEYNEPPAPSQAAPRAQSGGGRGRGRGRGVGGGGGQGMGGGGQRRS
ncbi:MAG: dinitrogenase iron-molybdenum cofactor biosynthesis protein [Desulfobulbaceae bacterium]|nr:dinitrogenase iron-molybdenum cofactor biosynthesis protein [Desulfobulbaceae bacterium]